MRAWALVAMLCAAAVARAAPASVRYLPPDPPRWRLRLTLYQGAGGSVDAGEVVAVFPTTLEFGARLFGPLSLTVAGAGLLSGEEYSACGGLERPNAILGTAGLRVDFGNHRSGSWLSPFVEAHAGVGGQGRGREVNGVCAPGGAFASGGGRIGFDAWLGRASFTAALAFDRLPTASPLTFSIGLGFILY